MVVQIITVHLEFQEHKEQNYFLSAAVPWNALKLILGSADIACLPDYVHESADGLL